MAPTLTATPQTAAHDGTPVARVLLTLTWPGIQTATIQRLDPDGVWRNVRNAEPVACLGSCSVFDHEAPLDQALIYRATSPQGTGFVATDTFGRTVSGGWGSADTGQSYATNGGTAGDYSVSGGKGLLSCGSVGTSRKTIMTLAGTDFDAYATFTCPVAPTGGAISAGIVVRFDLAAHYYMLGARWGTDGRLSAIITGQGVATTTMPTALAPPVAAPVFVRAQCFGSTLRVKVWIGATEPAGWTLTVTDNQVTASTVGARAILETGNTNTLPVVVTVDNLTVNSLTPLTVTGTVATLNSNPFFESTASPWTALGGTVARSTAQAHQGSASLLLTPDGVTVAPEARSENVTAVPLATYITQAWMFCAVARNVNLGIIWRNAGGAILSSSQQTVAVAANTWTFVQVQATAPALTAQAQITANMGGTPPSSNLLYLDEAMLLSTAVTVPSGGDAWLSHPGHPVYSAATTVTDLQATLPGRAGVFQAIGAALPVVVTDVRGGARGTVTWQVQTVAQYQRIRAMVADGGVLLMRLPASWSGDTWYILPGDIVEDRFTRIATDGWRRYQMPYTRVDSPTGLSDGAVGQTLNDLKATYATLNALKATGKTVSGLAANIY